jgi:hypothetical protein
LKPASSAQDRSQRNQAERSISKRGLGAFTSDELTTGLH